MTIKSSRRVGLALVVALATLSALLSQAPAGALPAGTPKIGLVCTPGTVSGSTHSFDLVANSGRIETPDGNSVFMWSYSVDPNSDPGDEWPDFQSPGPVLCVTQGETVQINLRNDLPDPPGATQAEATSIVFPGQDVDVTATGGTQGLLASEVAPGNTIAYSFTADQPGTYLYESGSDVSKQIEMGMYGALIVRPNEATCPIVSGTDCAYDENTRFDPSREFLILLADIDSKLHHAVETGQPYDITTRRNRYFTINGRSFPDTIQSNGSDLLPTQPYGALVRIQPTTESDQPAIIRMLNAGLDNHPFHPHGNHTTEIAQDGRLVLDPSGAPAFTEHFGETIGAGQTIDYLLRWDDQDLWDPTAPGHQFPVAQPNYRNLTFKDGVTWYSGTPYLGYQGTLPTGTTSLNVCGEWYFPFHSHALNEFTNFDEGFGGMGTLLRVDPYGGCFAFPTSTKILAGTLNDGTFASLAADDALYYRVNSTTTGTRTTDWYGQFTGIPTGATNLKVTYKGNNTLSSQPAPYSQNFNSLAQNGTSSALPSGWALSETGTGANTTYGTDNGGSTTPNTYSYRSNGGGTTDRALGTLRGSGTNTFASTIGAGIANSTGSTITSLTINYTGEQWRRGASSSTPDRLDFQYSTNATSLTTGTWSDVNALDFNSPVTSGGTGALNGNSAANRAAVSATIPGLNIANGATYWIRWTDFDRGGSSVADDGLAVDDLTITPTVASPSFATTIQIWNWATSSWTPPPPGLASANVGATDVLVADNVPVPGDPTSTSWASYIGTGANKGQVRVRVLTTGGGTNFVTGGNLMKLVYDGP